MPQLDSQDVKTLTSATAIQAANVATQQTSKSCNTLCACAALNCLLVLLSLLACVCLCHHQTKLAQLPAIKPGLGASSC